MEDKVQNTQAPQQAFSTFAAIDRKVVSNIVEPTEVTSPGREYVSWGKNNDYPDYLRSLRKAAATLKSVIEGCVTFTVGDRVECKAPYEDGSGKSYMNREKLTPRNFVELISRDLFNYGGFCIEVIRSESGDIAELYYVDLRYVRSNKDFTTFWYSEDWSKPFGRKRKDIRYPKFDPAAKTVANSLVYYRNTASQVYPECPFEGAVLAAELERAIDEYHWNSMNNGFMSDYVINMNNGVPPDEIKEEVEKHFYQKHTGFKNASRPLISWNMDREHAATINELKSSDFGDKYDALYKRSRQQIFTAFRANPNLFGIPTENLGFSSEEYDSAFKLFNRTVIQPAQQVIISTIESIYDADLRITPFTLQGDVENTETVEETGATEENK